VKLNSISIGGGLALVSVGLLANAAASLVGSPDRTANAHDLKPKRHHAVADVPLSSADEMRRAMDGTPPKMPMGGGDGCVEGEPLNWFGAIRWLDGCSGGQFLNPARTPFAYADVNGDGRSERLWWTRKGIIGGGSSYTPYCQIYAETPIFDGEDVSIEQSCVVTTQELAEWLQQETGATDASMSALWTSEEHSGWTDMDGDGDLDLILIISINAPSPIVRQVWLENTGFEKQTYAAGDINQDGMVDGVDISILLSDWTY
jgi:hypothetical protein